VVSISALAVIWPASKLPAGPEIGSIVRVLTEVRRSNGQPTHEQMLVLLTRNLAVHQRLIAQRTAAVSLAFRTGALALLVQLVATVAARILTT
jgi:hypothetical protein